MMHVCVTTEAVPHRPHVDACLLAAIDKKMQKLKGKRGRARLVGWLDGRGFLVLDWTCRGSALDCSISTRRPSYSGWPGCLAAATAPAEGNAKPPHCTPYRTATSLLSDAFSDPLLQ